MLILRDYVKKYVKNVNQNTLLNEVKGKPIDEWWLNNKKPVITKDGRNVFVEKIDYSTNPNTIIGKVTDNVKIFDYKWQDDGTYVEAQDKFGNPRLPSEDDTLVKA